MDSPDGSVKDDVEPLNSGISGADKYFIEQRDLILQDINNTMDSILNSLNTLNISLESSIAVGKEFESVSDLWKTFYNGLENDSDVPPNSQEDEQHEMMNTQEPGSKEK